MTYKDFKRELYAHILQREEAADMQIRILEKGSADADIDLVRLVKARNSILYGRSEFFVGEDMLYIVWKEWECKPMLYWRTEKLYERFCREGWQGVLPEIFFRLKNCGRQGNLKNAEPEGDDLVWNRLIIRPQNYDYYREELKNAVYWKFDDIALVLHMIQYAGGGDCVSLQCRRDLIRRRGIPTELVMVNALLQTGITLPPGIYRSGDINRYFGKPSEQPILACREEEEGVKGYRLTNAQGSDGAVALFYPGVRERLVEMMEGDYYVGFINNREVAVHPVRYKGLTEMKAAIRRVNAMFDSREVLTNRVYRYCDIRKRLIEV